VQSATKISSVKSGTSSLPRSTGMDQSGEDSRSVEMQRDLIARLREDLQVCCCPGHVAVAVDVRRDPFTQKLTLTTSSELLTHFI
jgi:hypothetical protein